MNRSLFKVQLLACICMCMHLFLFKSTTVLHIQVSLSTMWYSLPSEQRPLGRHQPPSVHARALCRPTVADISLMMLCTSHVICVSIIFPLRIQILAIVGRSWPLHRPSKADIAYGHFVHQVSTCEVEIQICRVDVLSHNTAHPSCNLTKTATDSPKTNIPCLACMTQSRLKQAKSVFLQFEISMPRVKNSFIAVL